MAILVDDLATWLGSGLQPTGIQRVVSELLETAYATPAIRAWPAVCLETELDDGLELVEIARDSLVRKPDPGRAAAPLRALRRARAIVAPLPMPRSLRDRAKAIYGRMVRRSAGIRPVSRSTAERPDLLLVPGAFWSNPESARRVRRLAERGLSIRAIVYDLFPVTNPEWFAPANSKAFEPAMDDLVLACDRIVVLSQLVADGVIARYPGLAGLVRVAVPTLEAHAPRKVVARLDAAAVPVPGPFIMALSTVEPRKNYRAILDAWRLARVDERLADTWLAAVGRHGWMADDIEAEIARDGQQLHIMRIVDATDQQVDALYRECLAVVHASWAEGFGLPARESVVRGIPTLMSSTIPRDGLPDGTYRLFDPADVGALASLMVDAVVAGHVRTPVTLGDATGWEPVLSALVD